MTPPQPEGPSGTTARQKPARASNRLRGIPPDTRNQSETRLGPTAIIGTQSPSIAPAQQDTGKDNNETTDKIREDYPNHHDDPDLVPDTASAAEKERNVQELRDYADEMLQAYKETKMSGEVLWLDFITAFRPHSIQTWPRPMLTRWSDFLTSRDIFVRNGRQTSRVDAIKELLFRREHVSVPGIKRFADARDGRKSNGQRRDHNYCRNNSLTEEHHGASYKGNTKPAEEGKSTGLTDTNDPDGSGGSSTSSSDEDVPQKRDPRPERTGESLDTGERSDYSQRQLGISGLMKAFVGKDVFKGGWDEDLDNTLSVFETLAEMCGVSQDEMLRSMPVMLGGDALSYFSTSVRSAKTYEDAKGLLRGWYNSKEKRARILTAWQQLTLSEEMSKNPESSEVSVFRKFVARLMALQKQLHHNYHGDEFLRDRLLTAVDIPAIQTTLRDRIPRTSHQAVNRVANQLSDKPRSAGSASAMAAEYDDKEEVMYSIGRTFHGDARRKVKNPWRGSGRNVASRHTTQRSVTTQNQGRRLNSHWMQGVRGCFVCGKPHRANTRHPREEVTAAIARLKEKCPSALLSVDDLAAVVEMTEEAEMEVNDAGVEWAEDEAGANEIEESLVMMTEREEDSELYFCSETAKGEVERALADNAYIHGRSYDQDMESALATMHAQLRQEGTEDFDGIKIDTGANRVSVMSRQQYEAYVREFGLKDAMRPATQRKIRGIGGCQKAVGTAVIKIPFEGLGLVIDVEFLIIDQQIPSLLSMKDMVENKLDLSIQGKYISCGRRKHPVDMENFFLIHRWEALQMPFVMYTESDLRRIHRSFGHPSVRALENLLSRAAHEKLTPDARRMIERVHEACRPCSQYAARPRRFKLTAGAEDIRFNHRVLVDTMFIDKKPIIHLVDEGTHFSAACFLRSQSAADTWRAILRLWIHTYMGPPDFLIVDQGSSYVSAEMKQCAEAAGIQIKEAPVENPGTMGTVERYHAPLKVAFKKIRATLDRTISDADCLQMAIYAVNSTMGPEGLCPLLLVFGAIPRPLRTAPSPTQIARSKAIEDARKAVEHEQAKRRVAFALRHPAGPKAKEISAKLRDLPPGSLVSVFRQKTGRWEGPHRFIFIHGETVTVQLSRGRKIFRSTCVKPWAGTDSTESQGESEDEIFMADSSNETNEKMLIPGKVRVKRGSAEEKEFRKARTAELEGLLRDGTFKVIEESDVSPGIRIFGSRFIDEVKRAGEQLRRKSRLVAQNYSDTEAASIPTKAPTVQRFSQRLALSLAASMRDKKAYTRDVTQAYIQARTKLERPVYIRAPHELNLRKTAVLLVLKPLYGVPESALHWYLTYLHHHLDVLKMRRSRSDPCVLIRGDERALDGIILLQVDDTFGLGSPKFMDEEEMASSEFRCKERTILGETPTRFNGLTIKRESNGSIKTLQTEKIDGILPAASQKEFASRRALAQYVGVNTRPDSCAAIQLIAPGSQPSSEADFKMLHKIRAFLSKTRTQGLTFVPLNLATTRLVLTTDASFANAPEAKSQLGYVVLMVDDTRRANIIHFGSNKSKRVARSVLAAEMHAMSLGFDYAYVIKTQLEDILCRPVELDALVDSKTLFNVIAKDAATTERRLQIDSLALRESHAAGELANVGWVPGAQNPADALTKPVLSQHSPLFRLMRSNRFEAEACGMARTTRREKKVGECRTWFDATGSRA